MPKQKKLSFGTFGCAILFFFLPFVQLSCMGQGVAKLSGVQLAVGTTLEQNDGFGHPQSRKLEGSPVAVLALACAVAGLCLSLTEVKPSAMVRAGCALAGVGLLFLLKSQVVSESVREGEGLIVVSLEIGFYLVLLALAAATAVNLYPLLKTAEAPAEKIAPSVARAG
jgi:hypothetical protein